MIYTVTLNPSLDYIVSVDNFKLGKTNRTTNEYMLPGGKGINVSIVLKNLGRESIALGFVGGFVGEEIVRKIEKQGIHSEFISLPNENSRINVKLLSVDGTEINAKGPEIDEQSLDLFKQKLNRLVDGDVLILAGSVPGTISQSIYKEIMESVKNRAIYVVVDASKHFLTEVLEERPFLIKPNRQEISEIFNVAIESRMEAVAYAKKLRELGAYNVLVSLGGGGALLITAEDKVYMADAPKGDVVNSVGAGDSMVAGFLHGWLESEDYVHALKMAVACGSASAFSEGFAQKLDVEKLYKGIFVQQILV